MATAARIYAVTNGAKEGPREWAVRLVRASTKAQALSHVARDVFSVEVASQDAIVLACSAGVQVEVATGE